MATVMESSYSIDGGANLIWLKVSGELTAESLIELLNRARADLLRVRIGCDALLDDETDHCSNGR